jgi:hypothetical protein
MIRTNDKEHMDVALLDIAEGLIKGGRKKSPSYFSAGRVAPRSTNEGLFLFGYPL